MHTDPAAAAAASSFSARALTYGPQIFLGENERPSDLGLMAHEVTHVLQQQGAPAIQTARREALDIAEEEAHRASDAVVRGETPVVRERVGGSRVQRLGALDILADKANLLPGFRMFTILLGVNPINMARVDRSAVNVLRALIEVMPGGALITQALDAYGILDKIANWVDEQVRSLGLSVSAITSAIKEFVKSLGVGDIFDPGGVWERGKRIFTDPIDRIITLAKSLVVGIVNFIKDAILQPLAKLAQGTRGWDLLTAVLGKDPITGQAVPRTAETLIGGFMKLIGQEEVWENMKKANAIDRAWAWFQTAMTELMGFVGQIPKLFMDALKALELVDIVVITRAFAKVGGVFGDFVVKFVTWAGNTVWKLLEIIFEVVAPRAIPYLKKAAGAFKTILKNPIGFVGNLVAAGKLGFQQFANNIGKHLKAALINWLTGSLTGVYIPKSLDFLEIVKFVLSVLGISWQNIRQKLVKVVGEAAVVAMETGFQIVVVLVTQGPAAAWEEIKKTLGNLRDMAMNAIMDYVIDTVVKKAVAKIISLLVPGGAFVQAIITIYDTILVFISKLQTIIQVATAFLDSIMAIANGELGGAASKVEKVLAGLLTLAISFLAGFVGLGKIADKVMNIINTKIRQPIDKALDKVVEWIVTKAKQLFAKVFGKDKKDDRTDEQKNADLKAAAAEADKLLKDPDKSTEQIAKALPDIKKKYKLSQISIVTDSETEEEETEHIVVKINPDTSTAPAKKKRLKTGNTEVTAIPFTWYKPSGIYKRFTLVKLNRDFHPGEQSYLDVLPETQSRVGGATKKLIGFAASNLKNVGDVLKRTKAPGRSAEGQFKDLLGAHGFEWSGTAPDHVLDLGWGGSDTFTNLWPLDSGTNSAANQSYNQEVRYSDEGKPRTSTPMRLIDKFFKIKNVKKP